MDVLIKKARNKDPDAFIQLMEMNMQSMYKVARAHLKNDEDVADAIQETILTCYEKIETLKQNKYFRTWLIRILINKCNTMYQKRKEMCTLDQVPETAVWEADYDNIEWNELLSSIDEKYRIVLFLYYVEGFKVQEISEILGMNESTIRTRLARGREKMIGVYSQDIRRSNA